MTKNKSEHANEKGTGGRLLSCWNPGGRPAGNDKNKTNDVPSFNGNKQDCSSWSIRWAIHYAYDANGNMTNDTRFAYEWDCENRLTAVRDAATGALVQSNRYDALWRRREKIDYAADGSAVTNRYLYKDWLVLAVTDGAGNVLETYTHGADLSGEPGGSAGGIGGILTSTQAGGAAIYAYDFNGNIVGVTDASGAVVSSLTYTPFGEVLARTGPFTPRYQFSTKEYSPRTGLNYYGYRYYSPRIGRWITRDPWAEFLELDLYVSVGNSMINYFDSFGLYKWEKDNCTIQIQAGDTLSKISQDTGIPIKLLAESSKSKNPNVIHPGQQIHLDGKSYQAEIHFTAYCNCKICCGKDANHSQYGTCYDGTQACDGTLAADLKMIPLGAHVQFKLNGVDTEGVVHDVGGAIKGKRIDIWCETHAEASKINFMAIATITIHCKE